MKDKLVMVFLVFFVIGMLAQLPLLIAQDNSLNDTNITENTNSTDNSNLNNNANEGNTIDNTNNTEDDVGDNNLENETNEEIEENLVCCHIFGYGAEMRKVANQYVLMEAEECVDSENQVGGGKEIVDLEMCEKNFGQSVKEAVQERNRLRVHAGQWEGEVPENCEVAGSTIKCNTSEGRVMVVMAGNSGNTIIQVQGINASTKVELYHHNGKIYAKLGENETRLIEYLPDQIRERVRARINAQIEGNETIELNEEGEYDVQLNKRARLFGMIPVKEKVQLKFSAENGELIKQRGPWWGFLAKDVAADDNDESNETENNLEETEENNESNNEE